MRPDSGKPYYTAYEKRYRSVYAQGVDCWTAFPEEISTTEREITAFLEYFHLRSGEDVHIVEFGCGEGYVGEILARRGYRYTGIDIAESAVAKATERLAPYGHSVQALAADILDLSEVQDAAFDAGIDVGCLHMLVVDADRQAYLRNACRVLKPGAPMLFCRGAHREDATPEVVDSYEAYLRITGADVDTPEDREAWQDGKAVNIRLPQIAARPRTVAQYRSETEAAGFEFLDYRLSEEGFGVTFQVGKKERKDTYGIISNRRPPRRRGRPGSRRRSD